MQSLGPVLKSTSQWCEALLLNWWPALPFCTGAANHMANPMPLLPLFAMLESAQPPSFPASSYFPSTGQSPVMALNFHWGLTASLISGTEISHLNRPCTSFLVSTFQSILLPLLHYFHVCGLYHNSIIFENSSFQAPTMVLQIPNLPLFPRRHRSQVICCPHGLGRSLFSLEYTPSPTLTPTPLSTASLSQMSPSLWTFPVLLSACLQTIK